MNIQYKQLDSIWSEVVFFLISKRSVFIWLISFLFNDIWEMHWIYVAERRIFGFLMKIEIGNKKIYTFKSWQFGRSFIKILCRGYYLMAQIIDDDTGYTSVFFSCYSFSFRRTLNAHVFFYTENNHHNCLSLVLMKVESATLKKNETHNKYNKILPSFLGNSIVLQCVTFNWNGQINHLAAKTLSKYYIQLLPV